MAHAVIVSTERGLLHLAERFKHGLQMNIENFRDWGEADHWSLSHGVEVVLESSGVSLKRRQCTLLHWVAAADKPSTLQSLHERLAVHEIGVPFRKTPAYSKPCKAASLVVVRNHLQVLEGLGLLALQKDTRKMGEWRASVTESGRLLLAGFK